MVGIFEKVADVQVELMNKSFESKTLDDLLPIIQDECYKGNLMFYFTFVEDCAILKIKDFNSTGGKGQMDVRLYYENVLNLTSQSSNEQLDALKIQLLRNTFLITNNNDVSSAEKETVITESESVPPQPIRDAEEHIRKKGIPISKKAIENYLLRYNPLKDMDQETKKSVLEYLKGMKK